MGYCESQEEGNVRESSGSAAITLAADAAGYAEATAEAAAITSAITSAIAAVAAERRGCRVYFFFLFVSPSFLSRLRLFVCVFFLFKSFSFFLIRFFFVHRVPLLFLAYFGLFVSFHISFFVPPMNQVGLPELESRPIKCILIPPLPGM